MGLFDQFPYTNFHEMNLDWILKALKELEHTIDEFVSINALKYADPIQWYITSQYKKNTIVIDPQTATAYISVQPVPAGVSLSDTDYWTAVFDLSSLIGDSVKNLTIRVEGAGVVYSTYSLNTGDWVIWNGILYKALLQIAVGTAYAVDTNIKRVTIEDYIDSIIDSIGDLDSLNTTDKSNLVAAINEVLTTLADIIGDLADLNTTDKSNLVAAINEVLSTITNISGDLTDLDTTDKNNLVAAINEINSKVENITTLYTLNVLEYGVKNDGTTDCSSLVQNLLDTYAPCALYFPCGKYLFNSKIEMPEKCQLLGDNNNESVVPMKGINGAGGTVFLINFTDDYFIVFRSANVFKGIMFYYPAISDDTTPSTMPYTFTWKTGLNEAIYAVKFQSLYFMNSWGCIECNTGHGDFIFNDIVGAPARYGIHLDWSGGTDIFTDVRMSYFYFTTVSTAYAAFMQANCVGIWLGYLDAFHAKALYFGNLNVGVLFNPSEVYTNGLAYGSIYGLSIDGCNYGIYSNGNHPIGVLISDMMANTLIAALETGAQTNKSYFQFNNSSFWNNAPFILQKSAKLDICNCEFNITANTSAIRITDSDTQITLTGCRFGSNVTPISNAPADSGVNTILASNNNSDVYPVSNNFITGTIYNGNAWSAGYKDIGNTSTVTLTGEHTLIFNQSNAITITESANHVYPSLSELKIFNYGSTDGSVTVNGITKTIPAYTACTIKKFASVWYVIN